MLSSDEHLYGESVRLADVDVIHDEVWRDVIRVSVEDLGRAERRHLAGPFDFAPEARPEFALGGELGPDHLDRDEPHGTAAAEKDGPIPSSPSRRAESRHPADAARLTPETVRGWCRRRQWARCCCCR